MLWHSKKLRQLTTGQIAGLTCAVLTALVSKAENWIEALTVAG